MLAALRLARTAGLLAIVLAVVGSVSACGSTQTTSQPTTQTTPTPEPTPTPTPEPTKSIEDAFTSKIRADDFQASGPITGSFTMEAQGLTFHVTLSGDMKVKGDYNAQTMTMAMAATDVTPASTTTQESISVGDWTYSREDGGDWTKEARSNDDEDLGSVIKTVTVVDKGVETHYGQQLHRLDSSEALDPDIFFGGMTGVSDADLTLTFWAKDDGTPAGMTITGTYTQNQSGTLVDVTLTMDYQFESLSGVTIEAPAI
jgi:hypothetical protein